MTWSAIGTGLFSVVETRTVYEPKFTYIRGWFKKTFPAAAVRPRRFSRGRRLERIPGKHLGVTLCAGRKALLSIFRGPGPRALDTAVEALARVDFLLTGVKIRAIEGNWFLLNCGMIRRNQRAEADSFGLGQGVSLRSRGATQVREAFRFLTEGGTHGC